MMALLECTLACSLPKQGSTLTCADDFFSYSSADCCRGRDSSIYDSIYYVETMVSIVLRTIFGALAGATGELPDNHSLWSYKITDAHGAPYMWRTLLPRCLGRRVLIHRIYRDDSERWLHNHPWKTAKFLIVSGGYTDERLISGKRVYRDLRPGDLNRLDEHDYHRAINVLPDTWTVGVVGRRCQEWGFLIDDERFVTKADYDKSSVSRS